MNLYLRLMCQQPWTSDRFIPDRSLSNTEAAKFLLASGSDSNVSDNTADNELSTSRQHALRLLKENLFVDSPRSILSFQSPRRTASNYETERKALFDVAAVRPARSPAVGG